MGSCPWHEGDKLGKALGFGFKACHGTPGMRSTVRIRKTLLRPSATERSGGLRTRNLSVTMITNDDKQQYYSSNKPKQGNKQ